MDLQQVQGLFSVLLGLVLLARFLSRSNSMKLRRILSISLTAGVGMTCVSNIVPAVAVIKTEGSDTSSGNKESVVVNDPWYKEIAEEPSIVTEVSQADNLQTYQIKSGDNLWKISEKLKPEQMQVKDYWAELIELNRVNLRSKNPDLIYPDEILSLPESD